MFLLAFIMGVVYVTLKALGIPVVIGAAQFIIFAVLGIIISGISVSIFKRKTRKIILSKKQSTNPSQNDEHDAFLFIFDVISILNILAIVSGTFYGIFAGISMLSVFLFAEYAPICIAMLGVVVIVIDIMLYVGCSTTVNNDSDDEIALMMYIESYLVNRIILVCTCIYIAIFWTSLVALLLVLIIMSFLGSNFGA